MLFRSLFAQAKKRMDDNIRADIKTLDDLNKYFGKDDDSGEFKGWVRVGWSKPTGAALEKVAATLKENALTIRNAPLDQPAKLSTCLFTGAPAVEEVLIARSY